MKPSTLSWWAWKLEADEKLESTKVKSTKAKSTKVEPLPFVELTPRAE